MTGGYSRSPLLLKGAIVQLSEPFLDPLPKVILFQYNPESFTRQLTPWNPPTTDSEGGKKASEAGTTAPYDPSESFSLTVITRERAIVGELHPGRASQNHRISRSTSESTDRNSTIQERAKSWELHVRRASQLRGTSSIVSEPSG